MAEALFRDTVRKRGEDDQWQIASAGVFAGDGYPATINACEVMGERGFDIRRHLSQRISRELMSNHALVLVMESDHQITLNKEYPEFADRIVLFKKIIGEESDTKDPIGGSLWRYRLTALELEKILDEGYGVIERLSRTD